APLLTSLRVVTRPSSFSFTSPGPPSSTLFPYTTLFRSDPAGLDPVREQHPQRAARDPARRAHAALSGRPRGGPLARRRLAARARSEEHTSELQSREKLVCRLLLEKKNIGAGHPTAMTAA